MATAVEELTAEAEKIALLTDRLRDSETASEPAKQELSEQVERARVQSEAAQQALDRATAFLSEATQ